MLIAAAVCPHPPLLVPKVTGASDPAARELDRLRTACRDAVAVLLGAAPDLPLSLTIGKWLLAGAVPPSPPVTWQGIASGAATADCLSLGEKLAALAPRVGLLAMGD